MKAFGSRLEPRDLCFGVATGGQVELIGFVHQLSNTWPRVFVERSGGDDHFQRFEVGVHIAAADLQFAPERVLAVEFGSFAILLRKRNRFKIAGGKKSGHKQRRIISDFRDRDGWQHLADEPALDGVVVEQHHAVDAEIEGLCN